MFTALLVITILVLLTRYAVSSRKRNKRFNKFMENMNNYDKNK